VSHGIAHGSHRSRCTVKGVVLNCLLCVRQLNPVRKNEERDVAKFSQCCTYFRLGFLIGVGEKRSDSDFTTTQRILGYRDDPIRVPKCLEDLVKQQ
jgi:hypothetical protein